MNYNDFGPQTRGKNDYQEQEQYYQEPPVDYRNDQPQPYWDSPVQPDYDTPPVVHRRSYEYQEPSGEKRKKKKNAPRWKAFLYAGITFLNIMAILFVVIMMMPQLAGYFWVDFDNYAFINGELLCYSKETSDTYKQLRTYMSSNVIYPGVFVDGVHVGGMSIAEAETVLSRDTTATTPFSVTVAIGDHTWTFDNSNIASARDLGNVLNRAYAVGRTNTTDIQTTAISPFKERTQTAIDLRNSGVNLTTTASYDHDAVKAKVGEIVAYVTRDPINAQIQSFDYNTRSFTFTESSPGVTIDGEALYSKVCKALDRWQTGVNLTVEPVIMEPTVTTETLAANFKLISAYTTTTTKNANRNTNIQLACQAVNGTALMPGETFSFNQATGERTTEKGYRSAAAIARGQTVEETGGGVCQVSSTLFNAAARANLKMVTRSPHAWPSSYVNMGEDATVDWPNLDFKFKNDTESPIFIIMYYKDRKCSA